MVPPGSTRSGGDLLVKYTAIRARMVVFPTTKLDLLELVPNVSEGRRDSSIRDIEGSLSVAAGAWLLDRHSDESHNRSVLTAVAKPDAVLAASLRLAARALARIDLKIHRGVHPRIGALDVLPLVPLGGVSEERAQALAAEVGRALADSFGLPVFLYADSARRPENRDLSYLRRGGFEALAARMAASELVPDYGPAVPHPTGGAVALGVRFLLIAYNVELRTTDAAAARGIARRIRTSGGGLPHLKALGFGLSNPPRAQVSMNLTDFRVTPLQAAYDAVVREASRLGVQVARSEIVGLIPEAASFEGMVERLNLDRSPGILEKRLREAGL
jgi:glutamate formiminotransferase